MLGCRDEAQQASREQRIETGKTKWCSTITFCKELTEQKYPKTKVCALRLISALYFSALYSILILIKNKHWSVLTDLHLTELVRT